MAGNIISTKAKRAKLKPSREPVWFKISKKRYIGFRRLKASGSWVARFGNHRKVIGGESLTFDQALKLTIQYCDQCDSSVPTQHSVQSIISVYCDDLTIRKSPDTAEKYRKRYNAMLSKDFRGTDIKFLTTEQIESWRNSRLHSIDDIEKHRKSKSTSRRDLSQLKALLNFAQSKGIISDSQAWDRVKQFDASCEGQRTLYLTGAQVKQIINHAQGEFRHYLQITLLMGARAGEASDLMVSDFNPFNKTVNIGRKTGKRLCYLNDAAVTLISARIQGKSPTELIFPNSEGLQWNSDQLSKAFKVLREEIGLPNECVIYSLRHHTLSKLVESGLPMLAISKNVGTSVAMIEKHYGHFAPDTMSQLINSVAIG